MKKERLLPVLAVLFGAIGAALRLWERATAFEPETGLPVFSPATVCLIAALVLFLAVFALLLRGKHADFAGYDEAFAAGGDQIFLALEVASAFLFLAGGVLTVLTARTSRGVRLMPYLLAVLCIGSFAALLASAGNTFRGRKNAGAAVLLVPGYTGAIWLVSDYQKRAGDPVTLNYACEILGIIAALLGLYFIAAAAFEKKPRVFATAFFCLAGITLCVTTLPDGHSKDFLAIAAAVVVHLGACVWVLLRSDRMCLAGEPYSPPVRDTEENETEDDPDA